MFSAGVGEAACSKVLKFLKVEVKKTASETDYVESEDMAALEACLELAGDPRPG